MYVSGTGIPMSNKSEDTVPAAEGDCFAPPYSHMAGSVPRHDDIVKHDPT